MALSRKNWNNIIIFSSLMMIAILTLLNDKTADLPSDAHPLFDEQSPLAQLQVNEIWLSKGSQWQCHESVLNCQVWANAWSQIQLSPVADQQALFEHDNADKPLELVILIADNSQAQTWYWYQHQGLLKSSANNWYLIPPSLREALNPIIKISAPVSEAASGMNKES